MEDFKLIHVFNYLFVHLFCYLLDYSFIDMPDSFWTRFVRSRFLAAYFVVHSFILC